MHDIQSERQGVGDVPNWTLVRLVAQRLCALGAHAQVPARKGQRVADLCQANDALLQESTDLSYDNHSLDNGGRVVMKAFLSAQGAVKERDCQVVARFQPRFLQRQPSILRVYGTSP